ncbi:DUF2484 family protein [uncultured Salipiger sp.]|uniref:DUF2484 family protein n=1 Tax=uncultured Salipiger sp. TaxID=499810 RepID=UPI0025967425|nr:DUF2484 family protein [uncultured Salipiger sp.]
MTASLFAACLWAVVANLLAMLPAKDDHWRRAWGLIACGLPILGWVVWENGPSVGLIVLFAGMSVLRWPVRYLLRWRRARCQCGV